MKTIKTATSFSVEHYLNCPLVGNRAEVMNDAKASYQATLATYYHSQRAKQLRLGEFASIAYLVFTDDMVIEKIDMRIVKKVAQIFAVDTKQLKQQLCSYNGFNSIPA